MFQIQDPDLEGRTVYDSWVASNEGISVSCYYDFSMQKIERLARADSDFSAFLHHAGVPSVDLYYGEGISLIDSLYIIISVIEFVACLSVAELWGLLGLRLADDPVLPFDYLSYSTQLHEYAATLITLLDGGRSLHPLNASVDELTAAIREALEEGKVYSPPEDSESKMLFFPGIADAISRAGKHAGKGTQLGVHHEIWRVARAIRRVAATLRGELI
ncbi:hypothetical protein B296_00012049 [Ensete ventricosum]|uniref:Uncharacterized protein n=1 Tax=Ensete ventricosum TaxID=4639 RepID=A0A427A9J8_ENSVE|nr:hypothetical protein B296_00012049 [Ensete ventricosum]